MNSSTIADGSSVPAKNSTNVRAIPVAPSVVRGSLRLVSAASPRASARLMAALFMRPPRPRKLRARAAEALARAHRSSWRISGHPVTTWRWGWEGPTALLVHGWGGRGSQLLEFVAPLRHAGFQVWMMDAPAHGESRGRALILPQQADLLTRLGQRLGGLDALVAHSFGAAAAAVASREAPLAGRMGLIAPPGDVRHFTGLFADALGFSARAHELAVAHFERVYGMHFDDLRADAVVMDQPAPTLIVHDTADEAVPIEHAEWLHQAWVGSRLLRTEALGHRGVLRDSRVVQEVVEFVAATRGEVAGGG